MSGGKKRDEAALVIGTIMVVIGLIFLLKLVTPGFWNFASDFVHMSASVSWPVCIVLSGIILIIAARNGSLARQSTRRLYRSRTDRSLGGVCAGFAEYCSIDPLFIRFLTVILFLVTFGLVGLLYIIFWASLPENPDQTR